MLTKLIALIVATLCRWEPMADHIGDLGYDEFMAGRKTGFCDGLTEGEARGKKLGYTDGYCRGSDDGAKRGHFLGHRKGFEEGYRIGSNEGELRAGVAGYDRGRLAGLKQGESVGKLVGCSEGRKVGFEEACSRLHSQVLAAIHTVQVNGLNPGPDSTPFAEFRPRTIS